jgi:flagellar hook assembly protein FlgD
LAPRVRPEGPISLPKAGPTEITIDALDGTLVRTLAKGIRAAGETAIRWDGRSEDGTRVASGIYFARLVSRKTTRIEKIVLTR